MTPDGLSVHPQGLSKAFNMWWGETEKWHRMHTIAASFAHRPKRKALNAWYVVAGPNCRSAL